MWLLIAIAANGAIAIGKDALADNIGAIAVGHNSTAKGEDAIALGKGSTTTGKNSVAIGAGSVAERDNVVSVGNKDAERQIINVADGSKATDAVNVRQVQREVARLDNMNALQNSVIMKHEQDIKQLGYAVKGVERNMSAGIASAVATASLPTAPAGQYGFAAGTGFYNGESAVAIGFSKSEAVKENNTMSFKINGSFTSNDGGSIGVGVGYFYK